MKKIKLLLSSLLLSITAFAADEKAAAVVIPARAGLGLNQSEMLIVILLLFVTVLLVVSLTLLKAFKVMYQEQLNPTPYSKPVKEPVLDYDAWLKQQPVKPSIWIKLLSLRPIEEEKDLVIDHTYDGIKELNNPVPAWFNFLFFGTMIFAAAYLFYYHIGGYGDLQDKEYENEMAKAQVEKAAYLEKSANTIDENSVKFDDTPTVLEEGRTVFTTNCVVCHGDKGQGIIGPNLTDEYWLHGGGVKNVFKTIKYGVPEKGMISWEKNLNPKQISAVTNFILSLKGTNPAGAKAPQGEKYEAKNPKDNEMKAPKDSVNKADVTKK
ncbi:cytochrome c oxidase cbb3-type subunit 3 [Pedobacter sp. W3I1]|uniref:cbb3-type cytochrome c oxidase N-terminal domain-containing protein n=1 Tax=Pedobacter sp. W3I1 TaxID=3042291 RepID=UPI00278766FF|nr:cbb3-type cytochrome c oxidase N-terminal domain-containing protein [Pedobacter sp. W3I1]MDQ0640998.1 cytochrome c oxidase cbb3-type subunit 3 [Pedobacter sp. W3I1]